MYDVKSTSQPDSITLLGNNYRLQIIETGFAEQFYASHRMGPAPICLKISARIAARETYRMIPLKTRLFSHWSIPLIIILSVLSQISQRFPLYTYSRKNQIIIPKGFVSQVTFTFLGVHVGIKCVLIYLNLS